MNQGPVNESNFGRESKLSFLTEKANLFLQQIIGRTSKGTKMQLEKCIGESQQQQWTVVNLPILEPNQTKEVILKLTTSIVLYRLQYLVKQAGKNRIAEIAAEKSIDTVGDIYYYIMNQQENSKTVELFCFFLVHCSRSFLEDSVKPIFNAISLLGQAFVEIDPDVFLVHEKIQKDTQLFPIIEQSNKLLQDVFSSKRFKRSLSQFKEKYAIVQNDLILMDYINQQVEKVQFVQTTIINGMVGNNMIYLSTGLLQNEDQEIIEESKCKYVAVMLHQIGHTLIRQFQLNNFLASSPRGLSDLFKTEAGYYFEELLFGTAIYSFKTVAKKLISQQFWEDDDGNILDGQQLLNEKKLVEKHYNLSCSGISCQLIQIEFR